MTKIATPLEISTAGKLSLGIASAELAPGVGTNVCPPAAQ
jgi:hypothetical protein